MKRARLAAVLALCATAAACTDVALPAPAPLAPLPVTQVQPPGVVRLSFEKPAPGRIRIICVPVDPGAPRPDFILDGRRVTWEEFAPVGSHPQDILTIEVIKRMGESPLYGAAGPGGLVIVTTRAAARR